MIALIAEAVDYTTGSTDAAANAAAGGMLAGFGVFMFVLVAIGLVFLVFWLMMLIDAVKRTDAEFEQIGAQRSTWLLILIVSVFVGFSWLAALLYYFMVKAKFKKQAPAAPAQPQA